MTKRGAADRRPDRAELEKLMSADLRALTAQADRIGRHFARGHDVSGSDFHALLHIMVAESAGTPLTLAQLRQRMDMSAPAITYLVDRMIDSGHIRRDADPADRRKSLLRYEKSGMALARAYFTPLGGEVRSAIAESARSRSGSSAPSFHGNDRSNDSVRSKGRPTNQLVRCQARPHHGATPRSSVNACATTAHNGLVIRARDRPPQWARRLGWHRGARVAVRPALSRALPQLPCRNDADNSQRYDGRPDGQLSKPQTSLNA